MPSLSNRNIDLLQYFQGKCSVLTKFKFSFTDEMSKVLNHLNCIKTYALGADGAHLQFILIFYPFIIPY